jgi:RND family efflux transporter MFP subunit
MSPTCPWSRWWRLRPVSCLVCAAVATGPASCGEGEAFRAATLAPPGATRAAPPEESAGERGFIGVVVAGEWADLEPRVEGRIEALLVKPGYEVQKGAVIARLDRQASRYDLIGARAALRDASRRYARRRSLMKSSLGLVAQEELDGIRREMQQERARVAQLERARQEATIVAPFAGWVMERFLAPGALSGPGRPVVRLASRTEPYVRFAVPEEMRGQISLDTSVAIRLSSPLAIWSGLVSGVSPEVDDASGMIYATAALHAPRPAGAADGAASQPAKLATGVLARVFLSAAAASR